MNTHSARPFAVIAALTLTHFASAAPPPPVSYTKVALTGEQVPDLAAGVTFADFSPPAVNGFGGIAFRAVVTGTGITADNNEGIIAVGPLGMPELVAVEGNPAPTGGVDHVFASFSPVMVLAVDGYLVFSAKIRGTDVTSANDEVLCISTPERDILVIAREGDTVPGAAHTFASGAFDKTVTGSFIPLGQSDGWGAFYGKLALSGGGAGDGVFLFDGSAVHSVALPGMPVPGVEGATFGRAPGSFGVSLQPLALAPGGRLTYHANFAPPAGGGSTPLDGFFVFDPKTATSHRVGALTGDMPLGLGRDRSVGPVGSAVSNGGSAILADWILQRTSTGELLFNEVVLARNPVDLIARTEADPKPNIKLRPNVVARRDGQAAGTSPRTRYSAFLKLTLNQFKAAAFHAQLFRENIRPTQDEALFIAKGPAGKPALAARKGFKAPGITTGALIESIETFAVNSAGQLLYAMVLTGGDVQPGVNDWALSLRTVQRSRTTTQTVVRTGQQIEVTPGNTHTVSSFSTLDAPRIGSGNDGLPRVLSDNGGAGLLIGFTGGAKGIFDGSGTKVPVYQPDILVEFDPNKPSLGDNNYDKKAKEQNPKFTTQTHTTYTFKVTIENDGNSDDTIIFDGGKDTPYYLYFESDGTTVNGAPLSRAGLEIPLKAGEFKTFILSYRIEIPINASDARADAILAAAPKSIKMVAKSKTDPKKTDTFTIVLSNPKP
jgi:hypothetical protein